MTRQSTDDILISEIFGPTIQGEGALIGVSTLFVRTGGCDYRCSWCDSLHAVESRYRQDWSLVSTKAVLQKLDELSGGKPLLVTLSGGNPAIQPFGSLIKQGHDRGYRFALETQGSVSKDWFAELDVLTLSPKPPSSEMKTDWNAFDQCLKAASGSSGRDGPGDMDGSGKRSAPRTSLKIVVFDDGDYDFARQTAKRYPELPVYLQPGNHTPPPADDDEAPIELQRLNQRLEWLIDRVNKDHWYEARVLPQLHVMLWGNKRGV